MNGKENMQNTIYYHFDVCVLSIAVTILASSMLTIPNKKNTKELVVTFVSAEKPMSLMYYVKINEYNSRLIIHNATIADLDALQELNSGDSITVRVLTAKSKTIKHGSVEIVEMKKADKVIVSLEKSRKQKDDIAGRYSIFRVICGSICYKPMWL